MRKVLLSTFLILMLIMNSAFAATSWSTANGTIGSDSSATVQAQFTINSENVKDQVYIGFTSDALTSGFSVTSDVPASVSGDTITLNDFNNDGVASNADPDTASLLNVYYQVTSLNTLYITLSLKTPMTNGDSKLGWNISYDSEKLSYLEDESNEQKKNLYTHNAPSGTNSVGSAGYKSLKIETENYRSKPQGTFSGNIYVTVSTDNPTT